MLLGTLWFVWNVKQRVHRGFRRLETHVLMAAFAAVGIGACFFVRDFLAVRGLAVVLLLLAKLMVDTGRPHLGVTHWVLVIQAWAYVLVIAGMWFTISPWRLRDLLNWAHGHETAHQDRLRAAPGLRPVRVRPRPDEVQPSGL